MTRRIFPRVPLQSHNLGVKCVQMANFKTGIYIVPKVYKSIKESAMKGKFQN